MYVDPLGHKEQCFPQYIYVSKGLRVLRYQYIDFHNDHMPFLLRLVDTLAEVIGVDLSFHVKVTYATYWQRGLLLCHPPIAPFHCALLIVFAP